MKGDVESIAFGGKGVLRIDGKVYFVPFTAPGDSIECKPTVEKKHYGEASLVRIHTPSKDRVPPQCMHFGICGGCDFQHIAYHAQCSIKRHFLEDACRRIGGFTPPEITFHTSPKEWHYREHMRLNLKKHVRGFLAGYHKKASHSLMHVKECPLTPFTPSFFHALNERLITLDSSSIERGSLRICSTNEGPLLAFSFPLSLPKNWKKWSESFLDIAPSIQWKSRRQFECVGAIPSGTTPYGFMQCNDGVAEMLRAHVHKECRNASAVLDLYGGKGDGATLLAKDGKTVTLIEANKTSCQEAIKNATSEHLSITVLNQSVESFSYTTPFDLALTNPPREGMSKEALSKLTESGIQKIVYTSCMPATLARDIAHCIDMGYALTALDAFDMFPQTTHLETVAVLEK